MIGGPWTYPVPFAAALIIAAVTSPAGVSGAVLLLPSTDSSGGSILAPMLIRAGRSPTEIAPATLASTLATSLAGVATFVVLAGLHGGWQPPTGASEWRSVSVVSSAGIAEHAFSPGYRRRRSGGCSVA